MKILTVEEKLDIAIELLTGRGLAQYAEICQKREQGCLDGNCEICQMVKCPYAQTLKQIDRG